MISEQELNDITSEDLLLVCTDYDIISGTEEYSVVPFNPLSIFSNSVLTDYGTVSVDEIIKVYKK